MGSNQHGRCQCRLAIAEAGCDSGGAQSNQRAIFELGTARLGLVGVGIRRRASLRPRPIMRSAGRLYIAQRAKQQEQHRRQRKKPFHRRQWDLLTLCMFLAAAPGPLI
jgi:hypothetical protein